MASDLGLDLRDFAQSSEPTIERKSSPFRGIRMTKPIKAVTSNPLIGANLESAFALGLNSPIRRISPNHNIAPQIPVALQAIKNRTADSIKQLIIIQMAFDTKCKWGAVSQEFGFLLRAPLHPHIVPRRDFDNCSNICDHTLSSKIGPERVYYSKSMDQWSFPLQGSQYGSLRRSRQLRF